MRDLGRPESKNYFRENTEDVGKAAFDRAWPALEQAGDVVKARTEKRGNNNQRVTLWQVSEG